MRLPTATVPVNAPAATGWHAHLALHFGHAHGRTTLTQRDHVGPLVVQKAFHPEGDAVCQVVIVHPPGGIAGGDALRVRIGVDAQACAQITQPAATKWYRSAGPVASADVEIDVGADALLEWLPQGTIVYDGARARSSLCVRLAGSATLFAWEVVCLGRAAAGERFDTGHWRQRLEIVRDGALIWSERIDLAGGSPLLHAPAGLDGAPAFGTFVVVSPALDDAALSAARAVQPERGACAVTRLPHALVARYRGEASDEGARCFARMWSALRPHVTGRIAVAPRIWST